MVLRQIQASTMKAQGKEIGAKEKEELVEEIKGRYDEQTSPYYAAARLWVDAIIDPLETRQVISMGIEAANNGAVEKFNPGVIQT